MRIDCNGEVVSRFTLSDEKCDGFDRWYERWTAKTKYVRFDTQWDNASDFYRLCPRFGKQRHKLGNCKRMAGSSVDMATLDFALTTPGPVKSR